MHFKSIFFNFMFTISFKLTYKYQHVMNFTWLSIISESKKKYSRKIKQRLPLEH